MNRAYLLAILWTLGILAACSIPGNDLPSIELDLLKPDKIVHFSFFLGFGWLWLSAIPRTQPYRIAAVLLAGIFYAIGTEIYQGLLPWDRTPDAMDAVANILGLGTATYVRHRLEQRTP